MKYLVGASLLICYQFIRGIVHYFKCLWCIFFYLTFSSQTYLLPFTLRANGDQVILHSGYSINVTLLRTFWLSLFLIALSCDFFFGYFTTDVVTNFASEIHFSISSIECGLFYRYIFFKMAILDGSYSAWI